MESNILQQVLSHDNQQRQRAEDFLKNERESNPSNLLLILQGGMQKGQDPS